jgi:hypothetical protein
MNNENLTSTGVAAVRRHGKAVAVAKALFDHREVTAIVIVALHLVLISSAGAQAVRETWVGRYDSGVSTDGDFGKAVCTDAAGNVYVTGFSSGANSGWDVATVKYNSAGAQQWAARYNGPANGGDEGRRVAVDAEGSVYVAGSSDVLAQSDYVVIKYDALGRQLWSSQYDSLGGGYDYLYDMALDAAGNVYVTGGSGGSGIYDADYATVKFDTNGALLWAARYDGLSNHNSNAYALALDDASNVYITGGSFGDFATIKYDASGRQRWAVRYNGPDNDYASALAVDRSGNVFVTGTSWAPGSFDDYLTIKYGPSGNQLWVKRYAGHGNGIDHATAIGIDRAGNAIVTGVAYWDNVTYDDYVTIQYGTAGNMKWLARYHGDSNESYYDHPNALVIDSASNVYVTGYSGPLYASDYATLKYDSAGNQVWVASYDGPIHGWELGNAIALGKGGRVYVTGESPGGPTSWDYATVAYTQRRPR